MNSRFTTRPQAEPHAIANGQLVDLAAARVPLGDRSVLFGDSVFETVRAYRGVPFRLWRHIERLFAGCGTLRIDLPALPEEISAWVSLLLEANGLTGGDARVRLTVTGGAAAGPKGLEREGAPGFFVTAARYDAPGSEAYGRGLAVVISGIKRNTSSPLSQLKTGNYMDSMLAGQEALDRGADDAVMLTTAGNLAEATSSNLFMVKDGEVLTPDMGCAFLPGVTREAVLGLCLEEGIPCREVMQGPEALMSADEVFLTNSMFELMPVRLTGSRAVPECPGPVTDRLAALYRGLVESETAK